MERTIFVYTPLNIGEKVLVKSCLCAGATGDVNLHQLAI